MYAPENYAQRGRIDGARPLWRSRSIPFLFERYARPIISSFTTWSAAGTWRKSWHRRVRARFKGLAAMRERQRFRRGCWNAKNVARESLRSRLEKSPSRIDDDRVVELSDEKLPLIASAWTRAERRHQKRLGALDEDKRWCLL